MRAGRRATHAWAPSDAGGDAPGEAAIGMMDKA